MPVVPIVVARNVPLRGIMVISILEYLGSCNSAPCESIQYILPYALLSQNTYLKYIY